MDKFNSVEHSWFIHFFLAAFLAPFFAPFLAVFFTPPAFFLGAAFFAFPLAFAAESPPAPAFFAFLAAAIVIG